jgi:hypothetical protein
MTTQPSYVPVLRWKSGEQQALRKLGADGTRRNARRNSVIRQLRSNVENLRYG